MFPLMFTVMRAISIRKAGFALLLAAAFAPAAHAGLFEDDDARRAILELRQKFDAANEQAKAKQAEADTRLAEQLNQLKRSLLELNTQLELQRTDNARLRGQNEQLSRDVAELQRKHTDLMASLDERLRRFEPQKVTLDDKEFSADPEEKRQYDDSLAALRKGDFANASSGLQGMLKRYPTSGYREQALFWLGNAQYGKRDYKEAIATFRSLIATAPESPRAPEAMLAVANCQAELKDAKSAKKTIDDLVKTYPRSEAAQAGKERLASLK